MISIRGLHLIHSVTSTTRSVLLGKGTGWYRWSGYTQWDVTRQLVSRRALSSVPSTLGGALRDVPKGDPGRDRPHIVLIDGSGLVYRSHFAMSKKSYAFTDPHGRPTSALHAFVGTMMTLRGDLACSHLAVVFDAPGKNFRHTLYTEYKQNRMKTPDELVQQFPLFRAACDAFGIRYVELEGYEADDIIATLARQASDAGSTTTVVSTDKDLMQLVSEQVKLYDPYKRVHLDQSDVHARFGVDPNQVVDVQALQGDQADNIPGVPGIGPKTAAKLIQKYGTLENLLQHVDEVTPPRIQNLLRSKQDIALVSKQLSQLDLAVPIPMTWSSFIASQPSASDVKSFFYSLGLRRHIAKFDKTFPSQQKLENTSPDPASAQVSGVAQGTAAGDTAPSDGSSSSSSSTVTAEVSTRPHAVDSDDYQGITTLAQLDLFLARAQETKVVAFDTETDSLNVREANIIGFSLATAPGYACYVPLGHVDSNHKVLPDQVPIKEAMDRLRTLLCDPRIIKIAHNLNYDLHVLLPHLGPDVNLANCHDSMMLSYALVSGLYRHNLDSLAYTMFSHNMIKFENVVSPGSTFASVDLPPAVEYAAEDADYTLRLYYSLKERLKSASLDAVYREIDRPFSQTIFHMEQNGVRLNWSYLQRLIQDLEQDLGAIEQQVHQLAGEEFQLSSPKQIRSIVYDKLGRRPGPAGKARHEPLTTRPALDRIAREQKCQVTAGIVEWKDKNGTLTTLRRLEARLEDGFIYPSYALTTGDSFPVCRSPYFDYDIEDAFGKIIHSSVVPSDANGSLLIMTIPDLPMHVLASTTGLEAWLQVLARGGCLFTYLAKQLRIQALLKRHQVASPCHALRVIVYDGILGGHDTNKLARTLGLPASDCEKIFTKLLAKFPSLSEYHSALKDTGKRRGYAAALSGRRFYYLGSERDYLLSSVWQGVGPPILGSSADYLKLIYGHMARSLGTIGEHYDQDDTLATSVTAQPYAVTHDQMIFDVNCSLDGLPEDLVSWVLQMYRDASRRADSVLQVQYPLAATPTIAVVPRWIDANSDRHCCCGQCTGSYHHVPRSLRRVVPSSPAQ